MRPTIGKIVCEQDMRDQIEQIALAANVSRATVVRMALEVGLPDVAERLVRNHDGSAPIRS